jgi:hypothetical protein
MTRRKDPPQRIFLTTALSNPRITEVEAEGGDPATLRDVWHCILIGAAFAACGWLIASGFAGALSGGRTHYFATGILGITGMLLWMIHGMQAGRVRQWARFSDETPQSPQTKNFVPTIDGSKTLVRDTPLRGKVAKWAVLLPSVGYSLTFARWVGKGKLFTRAEYETVRGMMQALGYMADDQLTARGRDAVGRWAAGGFRAGELHMLRGGE